MRPEQPVPTSSSDHVMSAANLPQAPMQFHASSSNSKARCQLNSWLRLIGRAGHQSRRTQLQGRSSAACDVPADQAGAAAQVGPAEPESIAVLLCSYLLGSAPAVISVTQRIAGLTGGCESHTKMQNGSLKDAGDGYRQPFDAEEVSGWRSACWHWLQNGTSAAAAAWWRAGSIGVTNPAPFPNDTSLCV